MKWHKCKIIIGDECQKIKVPDDIYPPFKFRYTMLNGKIVEAWVKELTNER